MPARLDKFALWGLLVLPLTISPILGLLTPYVSLVIVIPLFVWTLVTRRFSAAYSSYTAAALLGVFLVFAALFLVTADNAADGLKTFNFTMLLAFGAVAAFFSRHAAGNAAERVTLLATLGVVGGFAAVLLSATVGHSIRPTAINVGPIVLSNGLLALGFLGLGGALIRRDGWAWAYLLAPLLAIAATVMTESRGPLICLPFALLAAAIFFWRLRFGTSRRAVLIAIAVLVVLGVAAAFALHGRAGSLVDIVHSLAGGGAVEDESTKERLILYAAGLKSFAQSPWIGHGWGNIMTSVGPFLPAGKAGMVHLPQLHNDVLNFAVAGGVIGIACYFVILTAPLIGAIRSGRDALRPFRIYATTVIMIVYAGGGLTDLMFGFEFHTFLFAMLNAIVLGYCRQAPTASGHPAEPAATSVARANQ